ncbi:hypothetical protein HY496_00005, partial [Candidatus Woesearchaeota archaeon]|nr:hypothetical protein [Candidatus Woesearchaeota archaeon]
LIVEKEKYGSVLVEESKIEPEPVTSARNSSQSLTLQFPSEISPDVVSIEYAVIKSGIFGRKRTGSLLLFCNQEIIGSHSYPLPTHKTPLSPHDMAQIVDALECLTLQYGHKDEEERRIVMSVAAAAGIPQIIDVYFNRESRRLYAQNYSRISAVLENCAQRLSETARALEEAIAMVDDDHLHNFVEREKIRARERIELIANNFEESLHHYRQAVESEFEERRTTLETEYCSKLGQLEEKLEGHRQKIDQDAFKIGSGLIEIFPDRTKDDWEDFDRYDERVDTHLRKFYELKLLDDLKTVEGMTVDNALVILKTLKEVCVHRKNKATGTELREVYAGFRGFIQYVATHNIESTTAISRILETAKEMSVKTPKPSVEELLERAFPYDFDMSAYRADLHNCYVSTKEKLGLK